MRSRLVGCLVVTDKLGFESTKSIVLLFEKADSSLFLREFNRVVWRNAANPNDAVEIILASADSAMPTFSAIPEVGRHLERAVTRFAGNDEHLVVKGGGWAGAWCQSCR